MDIKHVFLICCLHIWLYAPGEASESTFRFLGIGYNLLTGNPDGGPLDTGGVDPGLLYTRKIIDLSHPLSVEAEVRDSCTQEQLTSIFYGTKSYQEKLKADVSFEGGIVAGIVNFAFSLSPRFESAHNQTMLDHRVFQDEQVTCNLGRQRFAQELAHAYSFSVTENFAASICALPVVYDQTQYMLFLDHWGTHVTVQVELGTKNISRRESSLSEFFDHVTKESGVDISLGGSYMGYGASLKVDYDNFKSSSNYEVSFGTLTATLQTGTPALPEPIGLKIESIDAALNSVYWQKTSSWESLNLCTASRMSDVPEIQINIRQALNEYATFKMASIPTDMDLKLPLMWPRGTYGLYKPKTGCPGGKVTWVEGWRFQDCEDFNTDNRFSGNLHMAGTFEPQGDILTEFCIKGISEKSDYDLSWPKGDYCLAKYGDCPSGFREGWIYWDDEDYETDDSTVRGGGYLPDGVYNSNTQIFYCCRNDNLPTVPIHLPTEKPFYLLRHSRTCQTVSGMQVLDEFVYWDEEYHMVPGSPIKAGGSSPFDDGDAENHKIHFCYYTALGNGDSVIVG